MNRNSHSSRKEPFLRRAVRRVALVFVLLVAVVVASGGAVYFAGLSGIGSERLRNEAQKAITALAGFDVDAELGSARLTVDGTRLLALDVRDVRIARAETGQTMLDAGRMRFGLRIAPLLSGRVELDSATIAEARIVPARLRPAGAATANTGIIDAEGLIDPAAVTDAVFGVLHRAFAAADAAGTRKIALTDVSVPLSGRQNGPLVVISRLGMTRARSGDIAFDGEAWLAGRAIAFDGTASRADGGDVIDSLAASLTVAHNESGPLEADRFGPLGAVGSVDLSVSGSEKAGDGKLALEAEINDTPLGSDVSADAEMKAAISSRSPGVSIESVRISVGRSKLEFRGSVGPLDEPGGSAPAYAFDLVSTRAILAPADSPEPALPIAARVAGRFEPGIRRLVADTVRVHTGLGELMASAAMTFEPGKTPGLSLAVSGGRMPAGHAKQLWPWFAASGARSWVLENVFGGRVSASSLRLRVPPGRLGNGEPLKQDEVSGRFEVAGTRFDVAGNIPPVRDGNGTIDFQGTDIDMTLSSGTVFMPSGRTVAASAGTLAVHDAHVKPRLGDLEIDIKGEALAVVELASYDPINAERFLDLTPDDVSGDVSGHISAEIPLQNNFPKERLRWRVALDYKDLWIARPFQGQTVTEADGSMVVSPERADIDASARLNGVPAELSLVEPLGDSEVARQQDIALRFDDESRDRLMPGLASILSGPTAVTVEPLDEDRQKIVADLERAALSLPWVGWRKGAGIPATASFVMETNEEGTRLSDFSLEGETFSASGMIEISDGSLASARFSSARLNRGDDFAVDIARSGEGYAVSIRGTSADLRPVIRRYGPDTSGRPASVPDERQADAARGIPVTLEAELDSGAGFNDESMSNVVVTYRGTGSVVDSLDITAATAAGGSVSIGDGRDGDRRTVRMQSNDAGAVLRFFDIYDHVQGGQIDLALSGRGEGPLTGEIDARDFWVVDESRLGSLVAAAPASEGRRVSEASNGGVDASRVRFERGHAVVEKGEGYLVLSDGVLSSARIGTTFEGTLYDAKGNISMTGTFLPAYGVNRVFGELPLIGHILGDGPNGGLIGITYRLTGKASEPQLQTNPISAIAPGIFRQIFEFR